MLLLLFYLNSRVRVEFGLDARYVGARLDDDVDHVDHGDLEVVKGRLVLDLGVGEYETEHEARMLVEARRGARRHEEAHVVVERVEAQHLQIGGHEARDAVEERLLLGRLGAARHELALVALIEDVLDLDEPLLGRLLLHVLDVLHARAQECGQLDRLRLALVLANVDHAQLAVFCCCCCCCCLFA